MKLPPNAWFGSHPLTSTGGRCGDTLLGRMSFDVDAFFYALEQERQRRELSWAALMRELNEVFAHRTDIPPISASTLTGMRGKGGLAGNWVIHVLMWLGRTPEEFAPGHPVAGIPLPPLRTGFLPRWDAPALWKALDAQRVERGLSWTSAATEIGGCTAATLRSVRRGVGFPTVMRLLAWLGRPASDFVINLRV